MYRLTKTLDYLSGHLRYGHKELTLTEEKYKEYLSLSEEEQKEFFDDECKIVVDGFEVNDYEDRYSKIIVEKM